MLLAVITGVSIVLRFEQFGKISAISERKQFRIVPVCVPSVRKWGAYNMRTIVDKFDFKFANRVNFLMQLHLQWDENSFAGKPW